MSYRYRRKPDGRGPFPVGKGTPYQEPYMPIVAVQDPVRVVSVEEANPYWKMPTISYPSRTVNYKLINVSTSAIQSRDPNIQPSEEVVQRFMDAYQRGETIPPILVHKLPDGSFILLDGEHRLEAFRRLGIQEIPAVENVDIIGGLGSIAGGTRAIGRQYRAGKYRSLFRDIEGEDPSRRVIAFEELISRDPKLARSYLAMRGVIPISGALSVSSATPPIGVSTTFGAGAIPSSRMVAQQYPEPLTRLTPSSLSVTPPKPVQVTPPIPPVEPTPTPRGVEISAMTPRGTRRFVTTEGQLVEEVHPRPYLRRTRRVQAR